MASESQQLGRPREFVPEEVVATALELFWANGYGEVSVSDLEKSTGVVRTSLYNHFGNKRGLFDAVLDEYLAFVYLGIETSLTNASAGLDDIHGFLDEIKTLFLKGTPGCLMLNSMADIGSEDTSVVERGTRYIGVLTEAFCAVLARAERLGEIAISGRESSVADQLVLVLLGLNLAARIGIDKDRLQELFAAGHAFVDSLRIDS